MPGLSLHEQITRAAKHLTSGRCVAIPTETVYGLAARVDSEAGVRAIFSLKARPSFDPLIVHIDRFEQIAELARAWPVAAEHLARKFWPGPLTLVVPKLESLNPMITSGLDSVGIRMPNHPIARELIRSTGAPLAAPSANRFGRTSPTSADHVATEFPEAVASGEILILDGGPCVIGVESTVCLIADDAVSILRPGGVTNEEIEALLRSVPELSHVRVMLPKNHQASPGHTEHHYETKKPLIVSWDEPLRSFDGQTFSVANSEISAKDVHEIELPEAPALAARALYAALRLGDQHAGSRALFLCRDTREAPNQNGLWRAIDDRISRAARLQLGSRRP